MKIKKGLALILALAMIITLMPTMAFAATTNSVVRTYTVATDSDMPVVAIDLRVNDSTGISGETKFRINLENAEWNLDNPDAANLIDAEADTLTDAFNNYTTYDLDNLEGALGLAVIKDGAQLPSGNTLDNEITVTNNVENNFAEITFTINSGEGITRVEQGDYVRIYFALTAGSEDGSVQVSIDGENSPLTSGTYTVATASSNTTTANVTGTVKSYPRQTVTAANVEIRETSVSAISGDQILRLTLPSGYSWSGLDISGDLAANESNVLFNDDNPGKESIGDLAVNGDYYQPNDRTVYVYIDVDASQGTRESLILTPIFSITRDAAMGDIALSIYSYRAFSDSNRIASASDLVIAVYGDDTVSVTTLDEENLPEVVAGYLDDNDGNPFIVQVTLEESTADSLVTNRYIEFDFNDEIQVLANYNADGEPALMSDGIKYYIGTGTKDYEDVDDVMNVNEIDGINGDRSTFTMTLDQVAANADWEDNDPNTVTFYIPVTAEADYTGDIELTVSGARAGIEDTTLTVGTVIAPVTVTTEVTDIVNGAQQQAAANITITENIAGYLDAGENIEISLDTLDLEGFSFGSATAEVTEGDLSISDKVSRNTADITIPVEDISTEVSTITISDVIVNLGRNLPEGEYEISVGGDALVENSYYLNGEFGTGENSNNVIDGDFAGSTVTTAYLNIITSPDTEQGINATFTDGQASYTLNGETVTMDVAPYIDSNNRMMVPIRYAANAMGVSDDNIQWNSYTQTGTISGAMGVVQVTVGSTSLITSNGTITMDTVAVNSNDRIYVPVRYIANALGASVSWDPATRTATFS